MKVISGFTLMELMITMAVGIILLAVGIPAFNSMLANNRASAQANDIVTALYLARSEAVNRGTQVSVCAGNGSAAIPTPTACSGINDWSAGFLVVVGGNIIRVWDRFPGNSTIGEQVSEASQIDYLADGTVAAKRCLQVDNSKATGVQAQRWLAVFDIGRVQVASTLTEVQPPCP